jgi:hypothetical protein
VLSWLEAVLGRLRLSLPLSPLSSSSANRSNSTSKTIFFQLLLLYLSAVPGFSQPEALRTFLPDQEIYVAHLPSMKSPSAEPSAVLATALETIIQDGDVCCGKDSGLESAVLSSPPSLSALSTKLQGKHVVGNGLSVIVSAKYTPSGSINPGLVIGALLDQQPMLFQGDRTYMCYTGRSTI